MFMILSMQLVLPCKCKLNQYASPNICATACNMQTSVSWAQPLCIFQAAAFERIKPACLAPFPRAQYALVHVQPFGSYANGLSLAASDIDVVITGVTYPDDGRGGMSLPTAGTELP